MSEPYDLVEHRHRFAAWAAARAASRGGTFGVPVEKGARWIEGLGLRSLLTDPSSLPAADAFDDQHRRWRAQMIELAGPGMSHGKAAKLINVYLKAGVVCATPADADESLRRAVGAIHPPIDRILLEALGIRGIAWSSLDSEGYERLIERLKQMTPAPDGFLEFWRLEHCWAGHAGKGAVR